jgi:hypothetical protein
LAGKVQNNLATVKSTEVNGLFKELIEKMNTLFKE